MTQHCSSCRRQWRSMSTCRPCAFHWWTCTATRLAWSPGRQVLLFTSDWEPTEPNTLQECHTVNVSQYTWAQREREREPACRWGNIGEGVCCAYQLKQAEVPIHSQAVCRQPHVNGNLLDDSMVCAGSLLGGTSTCQVRASHASPL